LIYNSCSRKQITGEYHSWHQLQGGNKSMVGQKNSVKKVISCFGAIRFRHQCQGRKCAKFRSQH
jgi:hypothetical protein